MRSTLNPNLLNTISIVLTMLNSRNNLSNQVVADVRQFMGSKVYDTMIPRNVRVSEEARSTRAGVRSQMRQ